MKNTRQIAFEILYKVQSQSSYSNLLLDSYLEKYELSTLDKKYISALVYGVIERIKLLDYNLSLYLKQPLKKLKPQVLTVLRLGAYQIFFMDKVHSAAAVNESVKLTKNNKCQYASGLVNAVLRNVSKNSLKYPDENDENYLSIKYSCEKWICDEFIKNYGKEETVNILENSIGSVPVYLRANSLKTDTDKLVEILEKEEIICEKTNSLPCALKIKLQGNPANTKAYKEGLFHVQDLSSQICCNLVDAKENEKVLDVCAAPGGKSFTISQYMNNKGQLVSCDIYEHRLKLIENGASRLGISIIQTKANDASKENDLFGEFDRVLCDVPCSGLGIIRRKPEIRYKLKEDIDKLSDLQYHIMCISSKYVKLGGMLIYSTCTLNYDENERNCERFLKEHEEFKAVEINKFSEFGIVKGNTINILPGKCDTDGFFVALFERKSICGED
ncbi:MAG: 16S rRNA (cytosine(967)-C(5))-methyltransferase RsmB [Clostridia bacterium]|nr:16S rRNA (cytosine(967)-C(5))-methyltransferase RsmB [Clostridia bacterium]